MADAPTTAVFKLDAFRKPATADDIAEALEMLAGMIREGYTSGDANGMGHWTLEGAVEPPVFDVRQEGAALVLFSTQNDENTDLATSWDASEETREVMSKLSDDLDDGWDVAWAKRQLEEHLQKLRLRRLGYSWADSWRSGEQVWTLTGPDGKMGLPSGGQHGWSECVKIATQDAERRGLPLQPPAD